jgi:hypothetical protein
MGLWKNENDRERWGYKFRWTEKHLPQKEIEELRSHVDDLGSAALEKLQAIVKESNFSSKPDLYTILRANHEDETLSRFWSEVHSVPDWVDWSQIERGQKSFSRYALANGTALALQGFIRENSVSLPSYNLIARSLKGLPGNS